MLPLLTQVRALRLRATAGVTTRSTTSEGGAPSTGMWARFKTMFRQYWYVVVPIDLAVTASCITGFYMLSARCAPPKYANLGQRI